MIQKSHTRTLQNHSIQYSLSGSVVGLLDPFRLTGGRAGQRLTEEVWRLNWRGLPVSLWVLPLRPYMKTFFGL